MATIVTRAGKGSALTNSEVDVNFNNLNTDKIEVSSRDAASGVVGVDATNFRIRTKNALGTFINFFTNATTAARTWTFPDKDGTVAMTSDVHDALAKTPVDADEIGIMDSAAGWVQKKATWTSVKTFLKTYFDTLYPLRANNLSDLTDAGTARTNLGLGTLATQNGTFSGTSSGTNTGDNAVNNLYAADYRLANFVANTDYLGPGGTTTFGQPASAAMSASVSDGGLTFMAQGSGGTAGAAFCTFHRPGVYAVHFGVDIDNKLKFGGWSEGAISYEIYHAKNIATQVLGHHTTGFGFLDKGNSGTTAQTINYASAPHQRITVTGAFVMNAVTNWPSTGNTGELLLELVNGASSAITWTMSGTTQKWWKSDGTSVATYGLSGVTFQTTGTNWILMWSTDAGTTTNFKVMT